MKIGDGCATVTDYKLPWPLPKFSRDGWEGGSKVKSEVRIPVALRSSAPNVSGQLLRQEKDEASPSRLCGQDSSDAFIPRLPESEGFLLSDFALVSKPKPPAFTRRGYE